MQKKLFIIIFVDMIGVIIINFGKPDRTIRFVLEECSKISAEYKVVVVDNGSTDSSRGLLENDLHGKATIIPSSENLGFARGNNLGASYALGELGADVLLFSNDDISFIDRNVVDVLMNKLDSRNDIGMIGPKVVGLDGRLQSPEPYRSFAQEHLIPYWGGLVMGRKKLNTLIGKDYSMNAEEGFHYRIMGSFMMMKSSDFKACGGFDPNTFLYSEEAIMAERLKKIGKGVWYCPEVAVLHEHSATISTHFDLRIRRKMRLESDCYYFKTYRELPKWQVSAARVTLFLKDLFGL